MQLSEAIRLGAMTDPQGFGFYDRDGKTCALGAAGKAAGARLGLFNDPAVSECWPILDLFMAPCPACAHFPDEELGGIITHLNDDHRWTREAIADWVATVEPAVVTPTLEAVSA